MEAVLDDDARQVATTISGHVIKRFIKRSSCNLCKQTLASQEVDLEHDSYLKLLSRGGLFVPSRQLADFVCSCFSILDFLKKKIVLLGMPVAKVATSILKRYRSFPHFSCNMDHDWSCKFASKYQNRNYKYENRNYALVMYKHNVFIDSFLLLFGY